MRIRRSNSCSGLSLALLLAFSALSQGQSQQPPAASAPSSADGSNSLAAAVRDAKAQKSAHSKKVFTDEDMEVTAGPLPRLKLESTENSDEVVAAINIYKATHTPEQTEDAVHFWYDRYDELLAATIQQNMDIQVFRDANYSNGYELCQQSQDYRQCQNRQMAEIRAAKSDQSEVTKNVILEGRIQQAFMRVRNALMQNNLHYEWFKVRTTNGIDKY